MGAALAAPAPSVPRTLAPLSVATPSARRAAVRMCFRILFLTSVGFEGYELPNTRTVSVLVATVTLPDRSVCSWRTGTRPGTPYEQGLSDATEGLAGLQIFFVVRTDWSVSMSACEAR